METVGRTIRHIHLLSISPTPAVFDQTPVFSLKTMTAPCKQTQAHKMMQAVTRNHDGRSGMKTTWL